MKKLDPAIFLEAAELVETEEKECCCYAIYSLERLNRRVAWHEYFFSELFRPERGIDFHHGADYDAWWMRMGMEGDQAAIKNRRVFALCLAAAVAEAE